MNFIEAIKALEENKKVFRTETATESGEKRIRKWRLARTSRHVYSVVSQFEFGEMIGYTEREPTKEDIFAEDWEVE